MRLTKWPAIWSLLAGVVPARIPSLGLKTLLPAVMLIAATQPASHREVHGRLLRSSTLPKIAILVDDGFVYAGKSSFVLKEKAQVERFHFVQVEEKLIQRMIVVQFEGFLEGIEGSYRFGVPSVLAGGDYRFSPEPIPLGGHDYIHNTWAFDLVANMRSNPGNESGYTYRLLHEAGYEIPHEWIMSRFVRAVGPGSRSEIILFYMEALSELGIELREFPENAPPSRRYEEISKGVTERSLQAIQIQ
jgi:hypothetical protein